MESEVTTMTTEISSSVDRMSLKEQILFDKTNWIESGLTDKRLQEWHGKDAKLDIQKNLMDVLIIKRDIQTINQKLDLENFLYWPLPGRGTSLEPWGNWYLGDGDGAIK